MLFDTQHCQFFLWFADKRTGNIHLAMSKHAFSRLMLQTFNLCDLFIDSANASRVGNCNRSNSNGMSFGIIFDSNLFLDEFL